LLLEEKIGLYLLAMGTGCDEDGKKSKDWMVEAVVVLLIGSGTLGRLDSGVDELGKLGLCDGGEDERGIGGGIHGLKRLDAAKEKWEEGGQKRG
jgi:hypothetical protein